MSTIVARTASEKALVFLLHWTDAWDVGVEVEVFRIGLELGCQFSFPNGDPRAKRVLDYLYEHPLDWTLIEEPAE